MDDPRGCYVTLAPRWPKARLLSAPDLGSALRRVRARPVDGGQRLAIWTDAPPPGQGPDLVVCVPVATFEDRSAQAEEVVARWDAAWLLIESVPFRHREAARRQLVDGISMALLAAAIEGVDDPAVEDDQDVGF